MRPISEDARQALANGPVIEELDNGYSILWQAQGPQVPRTPAMREYVDAVRAAAGLPDLARLYVFDLEAFPRNGQSWFDSWDVGDFKFINFDGCPPFV